MGVFRCNLCGGRSTLPRRYLWYFGDSTRCPRCGTEKLKRLSAPDGIDHMIWNLFRPFRFMGLRLYHCRFCRIQFYDTRPAQNQE